LSCRRESGIWFPSASRFISGKFTRAIQCTSSSKMNSRTTWRAPKRYCSPYWQGVFLTSLAASLRASQPMYSILAFSRTIYSSFRLDSFDCHLNLVNSDIIDFASALAYCVCVGHLLSKYLTLRIRLLKSPKGRNPEVLGMSIDRISGVLPVWTTIMGVFIPSKKV
jgi:hypothetical protein